MESKVLPVNFPRLNLMTEFIICAYLSKAGGRAGDFNQRDREAPQCNQHWFGTIFVTDQISTCNYH